MVPAYWIISVIVNEISFGKIAEAVKCLAFSKRKRHMRILGIAGGRIMHRKPRSALNNDLPVIERIGKDLPIVRLILDLISVGITTAGKNP